MLMLKGKHPKEQYQLLSTENSVRGGLLDNHFIQPWGGDILLDYYMIPFL